MKNWLIFDAMGVIFTVSDDVKDLLIPFRGEHRSSDEKTRDLYIKASLGQLSSKQFWLSLGFENWQETEKEYLSTYTLDSNFIKTAEKLSQTYNLAMFSNDVSEWSAHLREKHNLNRLFKAVIISGDVGFRKPNKEIYEILLSKISAPASNCIFVDDNSKILLPAKEIGMKTILFNRNKADTEGFKSIDNFGELNSYLNMIK